MDEWLKQIRIKKNKRAMPVLTFPAIQLLNTSVEKLISDSNLQSEALKLINQRCHPLAIMGFMDLSVEAEAFGANIRFSEDEVPTVVGSIIKSEEDVINLKVPKVGAKRTQIYLDATGGRGVRHGAEVGGPVYQDGRLSGVWWATLE